MLVGVLPIAKARGERQDFTGISNAEVSVDNFTCHGKCLIKIPFYYIFQYVTHVRNCEVFPLPDSVLNLLWKRHFLKVEIQQSPMGQWSAPMLERSVRNHLFFAGDSLVLAQLVRYLFNALKVNGLKLKDVIADGKGYSLPKSIN